MTLGMMNVERGCDDFGIVIVGGVAGAGKMWLVRCGESERFLSFVSWAYSSTNFLANFPCLFPSSNIRHRNHIITTFNRMDRGGRRERDSHRSGRGRDKDREERYGGRTQDQSYRRRSRSKSPLENNRSYPREDTRYHQRSRSPENRM